MEISHVLAHCLSEVRESTYKKLHRKHVLFLRIADCLMKNLGIDYATCYATLKIENSEYFSALSVLRNAKERFSEEILKYDINNYEECLRIKVLEKQIAQVDFYFWYFSVFARKQDGQSSKINFYDYCKKSNDPIANTYYNVLNMKEVLIKSFEELRRDSIIIPKDLDELREAYNNFSRKAPHYSIHTTISEEWDFLRKSYGILELCQKISEEYQKSSQKFTNELCFYKLYCELFSIYNIKCDYNNSVYLRLKEKNKAILFYVFKLSCGSQVICRGKYNKLFSAVKKSGIYLLSNQPKAARDKKSEKKVISDALSTQYCNIVIAVDKQHYEKDLGFIKNVFYHDAEVTSSIDKHNMYIDISDLDENDKIIFYKKLEEIKQSTHTTSVAFVISNINTAMLLGCMFSMLEKHLLKLNTPITSYVISPVEDDISFDTQSCDRLLYLNRCDFENIKRGYIPDWEFNFGSCFSSRNNTISSGKVLLVDKISEYKNTIDYVFYFEEASKNGCANCYGFVMNSKDLHRLKYVFSDVTKVEDYKRINELGDEITENDVLRAVSLLFNSIKSSATKKCHPELCVKAACYNAFISADLERFEYKALREYLYSYMGVLF